MGGFKGFNAGGNQFRVQAQGPAGRHHGEHGGAVSGIRPARHQGTKGIQALDLCAARQKHPSIAGKHTPSTGRQVRLQGR